MHEPLPALLVPGLGLGPEAWAPTLRAWTYGGPRLVRRLPGYGDPAPPGSDLHPGALAARLTRELPAEPGRAVVLGHSASCQVAAHLAAIAPERVAGLVLVGPTTDPRGATWPRLAARWLATARHETPRQVPALVPQYGRTTLRAMLRAMEAARGDSILEPLRRADRPVLVVRGRHDRICPEDWAAAVADSGSAGSSAATLPVGGHMVPLTHGPAVAGVVGDFVAALAAPGTG